MSTPSRRMAMLLVVATALAQDAAAADSGSHGRDLSQFGPQAAPDFTVVAPPPPPSPLLNDPAGAEGDLRLVSQAVSNGFTTGALQVFHDGAFGAVCNIAFDSVDADVACRQLGFPAGGFSLDSLFPSGPPPPNLAEVQAPFVLENLACTGAEERLIDCPVDRTDSDYNGNYDYGSYSGQPDRCEPFGPSYAFVACGSSTGPDGPSEGDLRLSGGGTSESGAQFGRLEVFSTGGWGTVCGGLQRPRERFGIGRAQPVVFSEASADVACQQLGFQEGVLTATPALVSEDLRQVPILIAGAACGGSEDFLTDCPGVSIGNNTQTCGHVNDVSVVCFNGPDPAMDGRLRLEGGDSGPGYEYGRLEVFLRGFWSNVCNVDGFTPDAAQVACAALGFGGGASLQFLQPFTGVEASVLDAALPVALAAVDCAGTEMSLLECSSDDARVPACAVDGANTTDATVLACGNTAAGCGQAPTEEEGSVRLVGGFGTLCDPLHTGIVEVFHFGEWGALCFGSFEDEQLVADVVCRQLGFPHGTPVDPREVQPESSDYEFLLPDTPDESERPQERFWLSSATCRGPEERLVDCDLGRGFRTGNRGCTGTGVTRFQAACRQFAVSAALEDVTTPGAMEGDVRLVGETSIANWQVGRLEVFFEGSWSQVCSDGFNGSDADVACRQLGYGAGSSAASPPEGLGNETLPVYPDVAITLSGCNGSEGSLLACGGDDDGSTGGGRFSGSRGCFEDDNNGLLLACVAEPAPGGVEGAVRLVDSREEDGVTIGIPQIFHAGAWGTFCDGDVDAYDYDGDLTEASAALLCRELGFEDGLFKGVAEVAPNTTLLPPWLSSLGCVGIETGIGNCNNGDFGSVSSCGVTQELICTMGMGVPTGTARLSGGRVDPEGAWAYGRLEVFDGIAFSGIIEPSGRFSRSGLGRNAAVVACRSLGFEDGVEITAGSTSALPGPAGDVQTINSISCEGDEAALGECDISTDSGYGIDYGAVDGSTSVAVLCSTPSGCSADGTAPVNGDVRLVPLINATSESAPCDAVHQGVVQIFSDGVWGLICTSTFGRGARTGFDVDAKVICGQLGFPFGSVFDSAVIGAGTDQYDYDYTVFGSASAPLDDVPVFATRVSCTGKEERLDECFFPDADPSSSGFAVAPASDYAPDPNCDAFQASRLTVSCRQFEIEESAVIRR